MSRVAVPLELVVHMLGTTCARPYRKVADGLLDPSNSSSPVLPTLALMAAACGGGRANGPDVTIVRPRAAYELSCGQDALNVRPISGSTHAVAGCGARATYTCMGGMGQYACSREGDVEGRTAPPEVPAGTTEVTSAGRPVSDEVLPRARERLGCQDVPVFEIARLTYAAHGCDGSVVFSCMGSMGNYRCQTE